MDPSKPVEIRICNYHHWTVVHFSSFCVLVSSRNFFLFFGGGKNKLYVNVSKTIEIANTSKAIFNVFSFDWHRDRWPWMTLFKCYKLEFSQIFTPFRRFGRQQRLNDWRSVLSATELQPHFSAMYRHIINQAYVDLVGRSSTRGLQSQHRGENGDISSSTRKYLAYTVNNTAMDTIVHRQEIAYDWFAVDFFVAAFVHTMLFRVLTFASAGLSCFDNMQSVIIPGIVCRRGRVVVHNYLLALSLDVH